MHKSPKYRPIEINSAKDRQKYFKNLYDEVNKSRMAVETITSFRNTEMNFKKKIDEIQNQLHNSMSRMNLETKKNVILKEIITLMKGEIFNLQKTQKRQEQKAESQIDKKIKKVQYDIQQILQKHNEQIAKINSLKQSASSSRSERVVFSNLFKKLEKEIKQNQELYKENLTKSEIAKDKSKPAKSVSRVMEKQNTEVRLDNSHQSQTKINAFSMDSKFLNGNDYQGAFITLQRERSSEREPKRKTLLEKEIGHSDIYDVKNSSRGFNEMISFYENFIDRIKLYVGFSQVDKALSFYQNIESSNQNLALQIQNFNEEISEVQNAIKEITVQKRQSECYQNFKELNVESCRRIKSPTQNLIKNDDQPQELFDSIHQVSKLLNLQTANCQMNQDTLKMLDSKLDLILEDTKTNKTFMDEQNTNKNRATTASSEGNLVDILLQKMDRFNQCEKILDKNLFKQEYIKQLGKNKKYRTKK